MTASTRKAAIPPQIRRQIGVTLLILVIFRLMAHIPVLNVNQAQLNALLADNLSIGLVDLFAGGRVLGNFSIVAAGVLPYIVARLIVYALTWSVPSFRALREAGRSGEERLARISRWLTIPLALGLALAISLFLDQRIGLFPSGVKLFSANTFLPSLTIISTLTAGSVLSGWLTDRITESGVGDGPAIVVWSGACLTLAAQFQAWLTHPGDVASLPIRIALGAVLASIVVLIAVYLREGQRRVPVTFGQRPSRSGTRRFGGGTTSIPLRVNPGGLNPAIMANGLLAAVWLAGSLLQSIAGVSWLSGIGIGILTLLDPTRIFYWLILFLAITGLTYAYNDTLLTAMETGENLRRQGGFIPGVVPGQTDRYLRGVIRRITLIGALGMGFLMAGLPGLLVMSTGQSFLPIIVALLISVDTVVDVQRRLEAIASLYQYEPLIQ